MQINSTGFFFDGAGRVNFPLSDGTIITFNTTRDAQAFILLHELAHQTGAILSEGNQGAAIMQQEG